MLALACAMAIPAVSFAQETPAPTAPGTPTTPAAPAAGGDATPAAPAAAPKAVDLPENEPLNDSVENFWHYAMVARFDVAAAESKRILDAKPDPRLLLEMFEKVAAGHNTNLDVWLLRWQGGDEPIKTAATQLNEYLKIGHDARRADPVAIEANIQLLAKNERGYDIAIDRLRDSGELAIPVMIDDLRDPAKRETHAAIRRGLRDMGLAAVNPLLAATEMRDESTLISVVNVLGDLGYDVAVPYLANLLHSTDVPESVKRATVDALHHLRVSSPDAVNPADQFYMLAEKFYYDNAAVRADKRMPIGRVWYWGNTRGLTDVVVPQAIFHDVMSKRCAEYAMRLPNPSADTPDKALSLWLSANFQDEAELPAGEKDKTQPDGAPSAHYWGALSGVRYLNDALSRANHDKNAPVAIRIVQALQDVGGQANLFQGSGPTGGEHPLMDAMNFPDRLVRYEAAFALAAALPRDTFPGEERVVPLLAEALSQTGAATVLVMVPQDRLNKTIDGLKGQGYNAIGGATVDDAMKEGNARPAVDAIVMTEDDSPTEIQNLETQAANSPRLARAVRLIITKTKASPYQVQAVADPTLSTTQVKPDDFAGLKTAIDDARKRGGLLPLDADAAAKYATRAADLLSRIAINRSPVYDVTVAEPLLLAALDDTRPDIVKYDAMVLGLINSGEVQQALLTKAGDAGTSDDLKIPLFKAVATSARNFGNLLTPDQVDALQKVVAAAPNVDVRTAAGEARGALNLTADQAKKLIVDQAKVTD
jgi:HEAT repeat protein